MPKKIHSNILNKTIELPDLGQLKAVVAEHTRKRFENEKEGAVKAQGMIKRDDSHMIRMYLEDNGIALKDLLNAYGFGNIGKVKIEALYDNDGTKPLFNAVVEDYIRNAFEKMYDASGLVARKIPIDQMVGAYKVLEDHSNDDVEFGMIGQGSEITVSEIGLDSENLVRVFKRGRGIELTDEAKSMNFDMLALQLQMRAKRMAKAELAYVLDRLLNGTGASDQAPVIGIKTANTLKLSDMWYAQITMEEDYGFSPKVAVMNKATAEKWALLKEDTVGLLFLSNLQNGTMPDVINAKPFIANVPDNKIVLVDTDFAVVEYVFRDLFTETARYATRQVDGVYTTKISDYAILEKNARLIIDLTVARP